MEEDYEKITLTLEVEDPHGRNGAITFRLKRPTNSGDARVQATISLHLFRGISSGRNHRSGFRANGDHSNYFSSVQVLKDAHTKGTLSENACPL